MCCTPYSPTAMLVFMLSKASEHTLSSLFHKTHKTYILCKSKKARKQVCYILDAIFTTVRSAFMVKLTHIRHCLTPCASPMSDGQELMTVFNK